MAKSVDSIRDFARYFGTAPLRDVVGKATQIWMSRGDDSFRWERFGLVIK